MIAAVAVGFAFGFIGSMPIAGPIAVLVFAKALQGRAKAALYIGLGCALAETAYAMFAFFGFSTLLADYPWVVPVSRAAAAAILLLLGLHFVRGRPAEAPAPKPERRAGSFALGFSITALNPTLLGTWTGATTVLFSTDLVDFEPYLAIPFGLAAGSGIAAWYVVLVALVRRYRGRFSDGVLRGIVRVMGFFLIAVGLWFAWSFASYL